MGSFRRARTEFSLPQSALHDSPESVTFSLYSAEEILALSSCNVLNPNSFNQLGHPITGGLYDLRMGPYSDRNDLMCSTCLLACEHCPGHLGHIKLPLPVCNPLFYSTILQLLKLTCITCHKFRIPEYQKELFLVRQKLLEKGLIIAAQDASEVVGGEDSLDLLEEDTKKAAKKAAKKGSMTAESLVKLRDFCQTEIGKHEAEKKLARSRGETVPLNLNTRSVEDLKKMYRKTFLKLSTGKGTCEHCGAVTKNIVHYRSRFIYEGLKSNQDLDMSSMGSAAAARKRKMGESEKTELNAEELKRHFGMVWSEDSQVLTYLFPMLAKSKLKIPMDVFFIDVLAVPPPKTRPCQFTGGIMTLHPQSTGLTYVVETVTVMKAVLQMMKGTNPDLMGDEIRNMLSSLRGDTSQLKLDMVWKELQGHVDHVLDKDMKSGVTAKVGWGFKQLIERKTGIFRMHMMGKRVNFAARTVITPDPNISIDEIGLPEVFAKQLTYRVPVTPWNVEELRQMVCNGPNIHPGAVYVEYENGVKKLIDDSDFVQREALSKTLLTPGTNADEGSTKFVYRHLINGDAMLVNRQPTLHKPSIMSHRARVLKGEKVMRLHYAICKSYNADFDGDEMNAHFPQNEVARAEAYNIVNVCKQYLVPKDGTPLQGLIQDHIISGVKMTVRGRFFERDEYQQHVFGALVDVPGRIKTLPPAIIKPRPLWSGKQIISTIIMNLVPEGKEPPNLMSSAKIKANLWSNRPKRRYSGYQIPERTSPNGSVMCESEVIIRNGEFLCGILDKNQYGATPYSLTHVFYELYGGTYSGKLLSAFSKIFTNFLHTEGFTLGVEDILVTKEANAARREIMERTRLLGDVLAANGVGLNDGRNELGRVDKEELMEKLEQFHRESRTIVKKRMDIDRAYKDKLTPACNEVNNNCIPDGLIKKFPYNNLQLMVQAGAKGSMVNAMQISSILGQIELEGKRPPLMISGKSLPCFRPYDTNPRAGGFIDGRFLNGIRPQELFFQCMAGREGLIDTAVKTSRSGYLQRCLIKLLEGLVVNYDLTVRDSDGSVVQFQYGEDSMDVCKSQYLKAGQLKFLQQNKKSVLDKRSVKMAKKNSDEKGVAETKQKFKDWQESHGQRTRMSSGFLKYCKTKKAKKLIKEDREDAKSAPANKKAALSKVVLGWHKLDPDDRQFFADKAPRCPNPLTSIHRPDSNFGAVTEAIDNMIESYLEDNAETKDFKKEITKKEFTDMIHLKCMRSMVDPGEPVGILAAQSVGEPSTQMTLNTFHFAGRGDMNITLGIPRLREILMVASANIKTPSMTIPFLDGISDREKERLRVSLNRVTLSDVLETVQITETTVVRGKRQRNVKMRFEFLPRKAYKDKYDVEPRQVLQFFERTYITKSLMPILSAILKEKKRIVESKTDSGPSSRATAAGASSSHDDPDNPPEKNSKDILEQGRAGEEHNSSDEDELADDADATETRKKNRQQDQDHEEGLSEDDLELVKGLAEELDEELPDIPGGGGGGRDSEDDGFEDDPLPEQEASEPSLSRSASPYHAKTSTTDPKRIQHVTNLLFGKATAVGIVSYDYDADKSVWCELTLSLDIGKKSLDMSNVVKKASSSAVIKEVKNIKRAFIIKDVKGNPVLTTEGVNITEMFRKDQILDLKQLACNNVHEVAKFYGIEAANRTIVREIVNVFHVYGITINPRHLTLIGDYMTFDGTYKPFNRIGIENNPSPLQQMTFETAISFLRNATLGGKTDTLDSPSSCIVMGKPCYGGTSSFKVVQNLMASVKENETAF